MKLDYQRVLIVDDEPDHRLIIRLLLNKFWSPELCFAEACSGKEAIWATQNWQPNLILINLKLPETDGHDVIRQIRTLEAKSISTLDDLKVLDPIWIIAMSTNVRRLERDRAFVAGCDAFLIKPFWMDNLFAQLPDSTATTFLSNPRREDVCYAEAQF